MSAAAPRVGPPELWRYRAGCWGLSARFSSSGAEIQVDAVVATGRLDFGSASEVGDTVLAQRPDLREFGKGSEFSMEAQDPAGGFGMLGEGGNTCLLGRVEFDYAFIALEGGGDEAVRRGSSQVH